MDVVENLELGARQSGRVEKPPEKGLRLGREPEMEQDVDGHGRVPQPAVPVVPVALTAGNLRERGRGRGEDRSGRREHEELQRQHAAIHEVAILATVGASVEPVPPPCGRVGKALVRGRPQLAEDDRRGIGAREGDVAALAGTHAVPPFPARSRIPSHHRDVRSQGHPDRAPIEVDAQRAPISTPVDAPAIVESGVAQRLDLHRALKAFDAPQDLMLGRQPPGGGSRDRHGFRDTKDTVVGVERGFQDVGVREIASLAGVRGCGPDPEPAASLRVQEGAEHGG